MLKNEDLGITTTVNNGYKDVPSVLLEPIAVTKNNIEETIIKDGFHSKEDIYGK